MLSSEASFGRRFAQCFCAIFWCLLAGGPIFGFAALKPVLIEGGVYESECDVSVNPPWLSFLASNEVHASKSGIVAKCTAQDLRLNLMFTVGAVLTNVSAFVIGRVLDVYGPRVCGLVGAGFLYLACFVFIFSDALEDIRFFDPYLVGYGAMALGGPFSFISSFQLSNSFPQRSGTVLALLTGAFDASSAVFLIYKLAYDATNGGFTLEKFFCMYLMVPVFMTLAQIFVMPAESYKTPPETTLCVDDHPPVPEPGTSETTPLVDPPHNHRRDSIGDALKQPYAEEGEEALVQSSGGVFGILHGYSAEFQMKTPWFYLMCCFATIQMLRLNYFVATINTQYTYLLHSISRAESLNRFFDVALPLGGVLSIPFVGMFLDHMSTVVVLASLLTVSLVIGVLGLFGSYITGVLNVCLFVVYRPFFYTAVSDFCAKVFGFDTFGTVYGAIICTSGVFNYLQSFLDKVTHENFAMNPTPVNAITIALTFVIGVATVSYVSQQAKDYAKKKSDGATS
ncbi:Protein FMP42 [Meyerozyma sp. JA9]|nr:Protein FMP42 [Meyerozyma sp. JA9]